MAAITGQPMPSPPLITAASRIALGHGQAATTATAPVSGTSPWSDAANTLLAFPFMLEVQTTVYKGFAVTGSAANAGTNFEVGILDSAFNKIVSSGSVSQGGTNSVPVVADLTDTTLPPGLYYAAMSCDNTTTNRWTRWTVATIGTLKWQSLGCWKQASAGPGSFPTTATPADLTNTAFPVFGLITRSVFDA